MSTKEKSKISQSTKSESGEKSSLILHNDDHNTFEFVIDTLIEVCAHDLVQAEQCALITHTKGKCDVKNGTYDSLKPFKDAMIDRGLGVTIESIPA